MSSGVFVIRKDGSLVEMKLNDYGSEAILQDYVAKYPNLLPGDQIDALNPRKWLLISNEYGVPDKAEAPDRWSLDHLFLDQDGIPTLVEVKRSSDTRIRREVVGQMLDYAANASEYWNVERIMATFENKCIESEIAPQEEWEEKLGLAISYEEYWIKVKVNLENSNLRLLFVADRIPFELRRVVEFLNDVMPKVQVLAVELPQYTEMEMTAITPRVYGQTTKTQSRKYSPKKDAMTEEDFFSNIDENGKNFFKALFTAAEENGHNLHWVPSGIHIRIKNRNGKYVSYFSGHPNTEKSTQDVKTIYNDIFWYYPETEELLEYRQKFLDTGLFKPVGKKHEIIWAVGKVDKDMISEIVDLYLGLADTMRKTKPK